MKVDKKLLQWTGLIVVLIILFTLASLMQQKQAEKVSNETTDQTQDDSQSTTTPQSPSSVPTSITLSGGSRPSEPTATKNYNSALKTYTYRFQFSKCLSTPGEFTVKRGTKVMLDNRDGIAHTFKIDGKSVRIDGYYFAVLTAGKVGDFKISCDGNNRAELLIQK